MKYILTRMAIGAIAFYLIGAFLAGSFDPSTWDTGGKVSLCVFYVIFFFGVWLSEDMPGE